MISRKSMRNNISLKVAFTATISLTILFGIALLFAYQMDFFKDRPQLLNTLLFASFFFLTLQFTLTLIFTHIFVVSPMQRLKEAMHQAETGQPLDHLPHSMKDEMGEIYQRFNQMLKNIERMNERRKNIENKLIKTEESLKYKSELENKNKIIERMNKELTESFNNVALLLTVSQNINSVLDITELLNAVELIFKEKFSCHQYALYFTEESHLRLVSFKGFPNHSQWNDQKTEFGKGIAGQVAQSEKSTYIRNLEEYSIPPSGLENELHGSVFSVPLVARNSVIGVLTVARSSTNAFHSSDQQSLESIASQIANAHDRSILYTQTKELSVRDDLTDIYNRRYFQQVLQKEFQRAQRYHRPFSVLMIDVDHFKKFNDTYGHLKGDQTLKAIANLLLKNIREIDVLARYGGEEFILLLPDTSADKAVVVAEKLRLKVEEDLKLNLPEPSNRIRQSVTISIGLASYPNILSLGELIHGSDMALYEAKNKGRNQVVVFDSSQPNWHSHTKNPQKNDLTIIKNAKNH